MAHRALCNPQSPKPSHASRLVLAGSGLAGLQLLQVPPADLHVSAVVVHALGEAGRRGGAVVAPLALLLRLDVGLLGLLDGGGRAAAEEAADGVADRGAYRYTTMVVYSR